MAARKNRSKRGGKSQSKSQGSQPVQRWTKERKLEVVLRLLRGESVDAVSREVGVESYRLEQWREQALAAMKGGLQSRRSKDPLQEKLDAAMKRVKDDIEAVRSNHNELLQIRCKRSGVSPFVRRRSKP